MKSKVNFEYTTPLTDYIHLSQIRDLQVSPRWQVSQNYYFELNLISARDSPKPSIYLAEVISEYLNFLAKYICQKLFPIK